MKKILIVSPHFPPVNAADMHRVRQSLPYFEQFGYKPTVLAVVPEFVDMPKDPLLEITIPDTVEIHRVKACPLKLTRWFGLGNLGIRAFYQLYKQGNKLLKAEKYDLVYFSTTVFASMPLGRLWKRKFKVPYVVDMHDPWRNDYYLTVPKQERPPKFWFAHRLNTLLEAYTIPKMDGMISVSKGYVQMLADRYPSIKDKPSKVLTFGATVRDFELLSKMNLPSSIVFDPTKINIVYVGRGGHDLKDSISLVFRTFKKLLDTNDTFQRCHFWFIGTSSVSEENDIKPIWSLAGQYGLAQYVTEVVHRRPYFEALSLLQKADIIFVPSSNDMNYTASKIYPNILAKKPLLCVSHSNSSMGDIIKELHAGEVVHFDQPDAETHCLKMLSDLMVRIPFEPDTDWKKFETFTAKAMTKAQCDFFQTVIE
ncbi:MAG TPA: glycosyltransferase [Aquaticitalea sp.]|nr:glycosyltransferase [Aquaticitalea sp.]HNU59879.1 glycosyltransferase [Aquaticitalea sp.]